jgi:mannose-6-phosphate isomerase-like protein (cupin superfamily)
MSEVIDLKSKLDSISAAWHPKIISEANGQYIKLAKCEGLLEWHVHDEQDEVFLCLEGQLTLEMKDSAVVLNAGQMFTMPRGVEHRPSASTLTSILLFEPVDTEHLGGAESSRTVSITDQIDAS